MKFSYVHNLKRSDTAAMNYVIHWMRNPDKGSLFEKIMLVLGWLPDLALLTILRCMQYDGILIRSKGEIVGHTFYQRHDLHWGIFSVTVREQWRRCGHAEMMIRQVIMNAHANRNVKKVMLGLGGSAVIKHIWRKAYGNRLDLPFPLRRGKKIGSLYLMR